MLRGARTAPGRPKAQDDRLPPRLVQSDRLAVQRTQRKIGRRLFDQSRRQRPRVPRQTEVKKGHRRNQNGDEDDDFLHTISGTFFLPRDMASNPPAMVTPPPIQIQATAGATIARSEISEPSFSK